MFKFKALLEILFPGSMVTVTLMHAWYCGLLSWFKALSAYGSTLSLKPGSIYNQGSYGSWHSAFSAQLVFKSRATTADFVISLHSKRGEAKLNTPSNLLYEKYSISIFVIPFLLQTSVPPVNCLTFTEDTLLRHAQFLVEQVKFSFVCLFHQSTTFFLFHSLILLK